MSVGLTALGRRRLMDFGLAVGAVVVGVMAGDSAVLVPAPIGVPRPSLDIVADAHASDARVLRTAVSD